MLFLLGCALFIFFLGMSYSEWKLKKERKEKALYCSNPYVWSFKEYQDIVLPLAVYPSVGFNLTYPALGLAGESGEVADKIKKVYRDYQGNVSDEMREALVKELGDVLWYITALSSELNVSLTQVAQKNVEKLLKRNRMGTIHGDGDDR